MTTSILIVDDSLTVRMDLAEAFAAAAFATTLCATAAEARAALVREAFALIVLDVVLPDGDGIDLLRELRAAPATATIPVMLLSSESEVRDRIRGLTTGADEYVGKPYDADYVVARAGELVRRTDSGTNEAVGAEGASVLVIDDSATFREELRAALEFAGYRVLTAQSGEEGLRLAAVRRPDAAIIDGILPGIDGATVVRRLRSDSALRRLPCLLLTAATGHADELRGLEAGADAYVHKSDDPGVILARLAALLRGSAGPAVINEEAATLIGTKRLLAVDDSPTYLEELATQLREEGYEVALAHSGEAALELLAVQTVDCILLDLVMPGLSGLDTCARIKAAPAWRAIPLVMLTAREDREAMIEGLNAGADDYVAKSSDFEVLKGRLRAQLRRKHFEDENRRTRDQLVRKEIEAAEARATRALAETRATLLADLERKNEQLEASGAAERRAHQALKLAQSQLVQSEKLASLGQMVAGVAHEINNPLAFVANNIAVLQRDVKALRELVELYRDAHDASAEASAEIRRKIVEFADRIDLAHTLAGLDDLFVRSRDGLRRIQQIVKDLREFARLDEGDLQAVDLRSGIESTLHIIGGMARKREVTITLEMEPLPKITCGAARINQVVLNLLANAIHACSAGGHVTVRGRPIAELGGGVEIEVSDDGCGIDPAIRDRIFDPFFTTKPEGEGTGLGLSISYGIVKEHGGTIECESTPGQGARFMVRLPPRPPGATNARGASTRRRGA